MDVINALDVRKLAEAKFASGFFCAESVVLALAEAHGIASDVLPKAATAFCSGMSRTCGTCGALLGAVIGVGMVLCRSSPQESVQPAYVATQRLVEAFENAFGSRECQPLLDGCDLATPEGQAMFKERGFGSRCRAFTGGAAEMAATVIAENRAKP